MVMKMMLMRERERVRGVEGDWVHFIGNSSIKRPGMVGWVCVWGGGGGGAYCFINSFCYDSICAVV